MSSSRPSWRGKLKSWLWTATKLELLQATRGMGQAPTEDIQELTHLTAQGRTPCMFSVGECGKAAWDAFRAHGK